MALSTQASSTPVAVVGAGPVGLAMALGLAREGIRATVVERDQATSEHSKAPGLHIRTREALRRWGVEERLLEAGVLRSTLTLHDVEADGDPLLPIDFSELENEADRPGVLFLEQGETERLLLEAVEETGLVDICFGTEATGLRVGRDGAELTVRENGSERRLATDYLVGADGAQSFVRNALDLPFQGFTYSLRPLLADVLVGDERDELPWPRVHVGGRGYMFAIRIRPRLWRVIRLDASKPDGDRVEEREVRACVEQLLGGGPFETVWASRFRIHRRHAPRFRVGRALLAGDAAHVHSPIGGLGMNAGIQDAHNLCWKLAAALRGEGDPNRLLDSYDVERRAVVAGTVSRYTDGLTRAFIQTPPLVRRGLFALVRALYRLPPARRRNLRQATMIDLGYPASPLLDGDERAAGRRLPDVPVEAPDGTARRLYDVLPAGPALLDPAEERPFARALPLDDVLRFGSGAYRDATGALRDLLGGRDGWILVRPDLHVGFARSEAGGLAAAVDRALGRSRPVA